MKKIMKKDGTSRNVITVTQGAYENIYRKQGYVPFETADGGQQEETEAPPRTDDELFRESVEAKPISQWSNAELKRYAALIGIDTKSKNLKEAIKVAISTQTMSAQNDAPPKNEEESENE